MAIGYTFPRRECPKCGQMISIAQFSKHEGTKACREIALLRAATRSPIRK